MKREEFSKKTKLEAFTRANGKCESCGALLRPGRFEFDHQIPCELGGSNEVSNCSLVCVGCHDQKTYGSDIPTIAKSRRIRARAAGIKKPSRFACSRNSKWKKKINGEIIPRS